MTSNEPKPELARPRIGIAYHQIAHYRRAIFDELMRSPRYEFVILSDTRPPDPSIALVDRDTSGWPWIVTPNVWIGPFLWQRGLVSQAAFGRFDAFILLGHYLYLSTWLAALAARMRRRRVFFWGHGWRAELGGVKGLIRRTFYRLATDLLVYGHGAKDIGIRYGFRPERIHVVYNSLDHEANVAARNAVTPERIHEVRRELFGQDERPIVLCIARLIADRRLDLLLEAVALMRAGGSDPNVLLVGDGPARASLEAFARQRDLAVEFYGPCYEPARIAELTMASDVTIVPNALGLTAIQSLTFGTPVVTHDHGASHGPEWEVVIPGRTGSFFRRGNPADLARAIAEWTQTGRKTDEVSRACREIVDRFWNPRAQRMIIERALSGADADDLFWALITELPDRSGHVDGPGFGAVLLRDLARAARHIRAGVARETREAAQCRCDLLDVEGVDAEAVDALFDELREAPAATAHDHWCATTHRLVHHEPPWLGLRRQHEAAGTCVGACEVFELQMREKRDARNRCGLFAQLRLLVAESDQLQAPAPTSGPVARECSDQPRQVLERKETPHVEEALFS